MIMKITPYNIYTRVRPARKWGGGLAVMLFGGVIVTLGACSTTSNLEDGEQLFTGLKPIEYENYERNQHFIMTQEEVEAALATAPNGALFGSSYYRTPFPYALWIYNANYGKKNAFSKWLVSSFGKAPVLLSNVGPELRSSVAETVLQNKGYFRGNVDYKIIEGKPKTTKTDSVPRPRTAKIAYNVNLGPLFKIDTLSYSNFPAKEYEALSASKSLIKPGDPFDVSALDGERNRIYKYFRNNGYYFYKHSYTTYRADTLKVPEHVQLQMHLVDSLPDEAMRKWVIGNVDVKVQRTMREEMTDTLKRRVLTVHFGGKKPPIRPGVILSDVRLMPRQLFSEDAYQESVNNLLAKGIFSSSSVGFTPRRDAEGNFVCLPDSVTRTRDGKDCAGAGILDMNINCVLDKPYDFTLQANYKGKTSGKLGPGFSLGFAKRNAFRGGELLSFNLGINYEFDSKKMFSSENTSYEISGDLSLTFPTLFLPKFMKPKRRRWETTPNTIVSVSRETINRSHFFRRHILSAELSYVFQPTKQSVHQFSPLVVEYDRLAEVSEEYTDKAVTSAVLLCGLLDDHFLTKMRYTYKYSSPMAYRNPVFFSTTLTESSNLLALGYLMAGEKWNEKDKTAFKAPFAQFIKADVDWRKTWIVGEHSSLVAHAQAGFLYTYGNTHDAPYAEYYYIGGANSLRGFSARTVGPGRAYYHNKDLRYMFGNGKLKCIMNLEYRPRLFGSLYGALFLDAGNVWNYDTGVDLGDFDFDSYPEIAWLYEREKEGYFKASKFLNDLALGVGVGIRYDLDFFVLRLDWGVALHYPYDTSKGGYFNVPSFGKGQCLNFAIGYPF